MIQNKGEIGRNSSAGGNIKENPFIFLHEVTKGKNQVCKIKCEGAVTSTGLSKEQFYSKAEISRQRWYFWSWGLEPFPDYIKIRLCDLFGKPFRDLFLQIKEDSNDNKS